MTKPDNGVVPASSRAAQTPTHGSVGVAELTHADVRNRLSDYLDNSLAQSERHRVDGHLAACRSCSAHLATLRATVRVAETLPRPKAPMHTRARILEAVRHEAAQVAARDLAANDDGAAAADA